MKFLMFFSLIFSAHIFAEDFEDIAGPVKKPTVHNEGISNADLFAFRDGVLPFEIKVDAISYMGCPDPTVNAPIPGPIFKLSAFNKGLSLTDEFHKKLKQAGTSAQRQRILEDSIGSRGQVSISRNGNIRDTVTIQRQPLMSFFPPLAADVAGGDPFVVLLGIDKPFEAVLPISARYWPKILPDLASNYHLTLTYNNGSTLHPLGPEYDQYYGTSYQIDFDGSLNYMKNIDEYDLFSGKKEERWSCPEKSRLVVLRHDQISEREYLRGKRYYDYHNMSREAVCVEDKSAFSRVSEKTVESLISENHFVVGFVHIWRTEGVGKAQTHTLEKTSEVCLTSRDADWSCYSQSNTARVEWNARNCVPGDPYARCPAYLSFCTRE